MQDDKLRSTKQILDDVCIDCTEFLNYPCVECENCPVSRLKAIFKRKMKCIYCNKTTNEWTINWEGLKDYPMCNDCHKEKNLRKTEKHNKRSKR